ncbi:MAG: arylsulfatase A-like enzyme [Verrucomicrobiales bacterium]|jgi:arylsulfatase A-like enzyme
MKSALFSFLLFALCANAAAAPRPNIILIMGDDMGISDLGCYGSEIDTPNLDKLAGNGLRFTQFYNTARCCPTRASLLSGLYPHQAGVGHMMNDRGHDGYRGELNRNCLTIAEALKTAGYGTYMAGKWHITSKTTADGPKDNWPRQRGFDRFYGTIHGAGSLWDPNSLTRGNTQLAPDNDPEYKPEKTWFYTDAIGDQTSRYIEEHVAAHPDKPFFSYVSFTAAHWPMHAREETIRKYKGKYDAGYTEIRKARFAKMKQLGIIDPDTELSPQARDWDSAPEKAWEIRCMEAYAAMVDEMDQTIGKIVDTVEKAGQLDNTLIFFLQDNGGCAEGFGRRKNPTTGPRADKPSLTPMAKGELQMHMQPKQTRDGYPVRTGPGVMPGAADTYIAYGEGWANVSNTPFREYKHWVHEGGIGTPLIAFWPKGIARKGELDHQPGHLIDIMATAVDLAGVDYPKQKDGKKIKPLEGRSLDVAFKGKAIERDAIFWEHEGNCAIRKGDWKLVRKANREWELYNIADDRPELHDLAAEKPDMVKTLSAEFQAYADRADVSPVGMWRGGQKKTKKKTALNNKERFKLKSGDDLPQDQAPNIAGRGILIEGTVNSNDRDGVIVAQGGDAQGYALVLKQGILQFLTCVDGKITVTSMKDPVKSQEFSFLARMSIDGGVQLTVGSRTHLDDKIEPLKLMPVDGLQVGRDSGGTVGDYNADNPLDGEIKLTLSLLPAKPKNAKTTRLNRLLKHPNGSTEFDQAAIALEIAAGNGFTTQMIRPLALDAIQKQKKPQPKRKKPTPLAPIKDRPGLPRVLLIGDSISIGYTLPVRALLEDKANVHRPSTNCASTRQGLKGLDQWLGDKKWDVIHFNWGLHDLKFVAPGTAKLADKNDPKNARQVSPEEYEKNLTELVNRLKKTGAKLVWRNTTPVPEGTKGRIVGDSAKYNAIAQKIMEANRIPTDDLFALTKQHPTIQLKANVHYSATGSKKLAEQVAKTIRAQLVNK